MILGILQARMTSVRLPGKVMKPLLEKPMISRQIERIKRAPAISRLFVATGVDTADNPLSEWCQSNGIDCFRGSQDDVLDRFYQATERVPEATHIVRMTADCPLIDPDVIESVIQLCLRGGYDYASNTQPPTYPDGLDVEIMTRQALVDSWKKAKKTSEREHVTPYLYHHPAEFKIGQLRNTSDLSALRWTVDETADFEFVETIYQNLYPTNPQFKMADILSFIEQKPELLKLNAHFKRNEGYEKSLLKDVLSVKKEL